MPVRAPGLVRPARGTGVSGWVTRRGATLPRSASPSGVEHRLLDGPAAGEEGADGVEHVGGGLVALVRGEAHGVVRDGGDGGRHPGGELLDGGALLGADGDDELAERVGVLVGRAAGERLVEHHAEGPEVGPAVDVLVAARLLGRHVERRAEHAPGARQARGLGVALGRVAR